MTTAILAGINVNIIAAALLFAATAAVLWAIVHIAFFRGRKREGTARKGERNFAHCELNEIMGYDFIQQKTSPAAGRPAPATTPAVQDTDDPAAVKIIGTTGRDAHDDDDGPVRPREEVIREREQQKKDKEMAEKASEEGKTEITQDEMYLLMEMEWPESEPVRDEDHDPGTTADFHGPDEDEFFGDEDVAGDTPDGGLSDEEKHDNALARAPEHPEQYDNQMEESYNIIEDIFTGAREMTDEELREKRKLEQMIEQTAAKEKEEGQKQ